jgi:hypothetical protein
MKNRVSLSLAVVLLLAIVSPGQQLRPLPDAPLPGRTPSLFWVAAGAYTASIVADNYTTHSFVERGCYESENPWLYGPHPNQARFLTISFAGEAAELLAARRMVRSRSRFWNTIGYSLVAGETAGRAYISGHNEGLKCHH